MKKAIPYEMKGEKAQFKIKMHSGRELNVDIDSSLMRYHYGFVPAKQNKVPFYIMTAEEVLQHKIRSGQFVDNINMAKVESYQLIDKQKTIHKFWFVEDKFMFFNNNFWSTIPY